MQSHTPIIECLLGHAGDFFGELGVMGGSTALRKATVRTVPATVGKKKAVECLRLVKKDVARILMGEIGSIRDAMSNSVDEYRRAVRKLRPL
jgi:hypothetical protein